MPYMVIIIFMNMLNHPVVRVIFSPMSATAVLLNGKHNTEKPNVRV
jgi:hypothetical protein